MTSAQRPKWRKPSSGTPRMAPMTAVGNGMANWLINSTRPCASKASIRLETVPRINGSWRSEALGVNGFVTSLR